MTEANDNIEFFCLGSGSSGNSYLLHSPKTTLLIDAGIDIKAMRAALEEKGFRLEDVEAVIITHDHADHIKSVAALAEDLGKPIYATQVVHEGMSRSYCTRGKLTPEHQLNLNKGETVAIGDLLVTPFEVSHDSSDCVGYRIEIHPFEGEGEEEERETVTFCLVTDCGEVTPSVGEAISAANYLVLEANHEESMLIKGNYPAYLKKRISGSRGHLSNRACGEALVRYATPKLRRVWLCHLSEDNNHPELARKTVGQILRRSGIVPGVEFELDVLKRKTPSELYLLS